MELSAKLQIKPGQRIAVVAGPGEAPSAAAEGLKTGDTAKVADVIVAFVRTREELDTVAVPAIEGARGNKLGTDLNRDILRQTLADRGIQPVRQVSIDEVWSALRFRPA
jgi:hypothetical protein